MAKFGDAGGGGAGDRRPDRAGRVRRHLRPDRSGRADLRPESRRAPVRPDIRNPAGRPVRDAGLRAERLASAVPGAGYRRPHLLGKGDHRRSGPAVLQRRGGRIPVHRLPLRRQLGLQQLRISAALHPVQLGPRDARHHPFRHAGRMDVAGRRRPLRTDGRRAGLRAGGIADRLPRRREIGPSSRIAPSSRTGPRPLPLPLPERRRSPRWPPHPTQAPER